MKVINQRIARTTRERDGFVERLGGFDGQAVGVDHLCPWTGDWGQGTGDRGLGRCGADGVSSSSSVQQATAMPNRVRRYGAPMSGFTSDVSAVVPRRQRVVAVPTLPRR